MDQLSLGISSADFFGESLRCRCAEIAAPGGSAGIDCGGTGAAAEPAIFAVTQSFDDSCDGRVVGAASVSKYDGDTSQEDADKMSGDCVWHDFLCTVWSFALCSPKGGEDSGCADF